MEEVLTNIKSLEVEIAKHLARRSQSDPTFRSDLKELLDELEVYKKLKEQLKQKAEETT